MKFIANFLICAVLIPTAINPSVKDFDDCCDGHQSEMMIKQISIALNGENCSSLCMGSCCQSQWHQLLYQEGQLIQRFRFKSPEREESFDEPALLSMYPPPKS